MMQTPPDRENAIVAISHRVRADDVVIREGTYEYEYLIELMDILEIPDAKR